MLIAPNKKLEQEMIANTIFIYNANFAAFIIPLHISNNTL